MVVVGYIFKDGQLFSIGWKLGGLAILLTAVFFHYYIEKRQIRKSIVNEHNRIEEENRIKQDEFNKEQSEEKARYEKLLEEWKKKLEELDHQYQREYEEECGQREEEYNLRNSIALKNYEIAQKEVDFLKTNLKASVKTKDELYKLGVI